MLDEIMTTADFETPLSNIDPVDLIPANTKFKTWQEMEQDNQLEHQKDVQQRYFHSYQPKSTANKQHRYPTRFKTSANAAKTAQEGKECVFLRDKGEKITPVFKQFEFVLRNKLGKPHLDHESKEMVVIGPSPNDIKRRVFLTKPNERGNMDRARVVELINKFDDKIDRDPLRCKFKIEFEKNTPSSKDTYLDDIMSYNDILDYVEKETNNQYGDYWRFRKIISHSLPPGKKVKNKTGIELQVVWETGATSTESFEALRKDIPVDLAIYAKENNLLEFDGWDTLNRLANRSKLTERLVKQAKLRINTVVEAETNVYQAQEPSCSRSSTSIHRSISVSLHCLILVLRWVLILIFRFILPHRNNKVSQVLRIVPTSVHRCIISN